MSDERDDRLETVPITDQISLRVQESVDEVDPAGPEPPPPPAPVEVEAPLEIEPLPPRPPPTPLPPTEAELALRRSRRRRVLLAVFAVVLGAAGFFGFTDVGRAMLPVGMRGQAKTLADDVERRAREATTDAYYTFTDDEGVVHIVDSLEKVPDRYKRRAKRKY